MSRRMSNRESLVYRAVIQTINTVTGDETWSFYGPYVSYDPPEAIIEDHLEGHRSWDPVGECVIKGWIEVSALKWMKFDDQGFD